MAQGFTRPFLSIPTLATIGNGLGNEGNIAVGSRAGAGVVSGAADTKGASYTTLIASTAMDAYGLHICVGGAIGSNLRDSDGLMDFAIGAASSESIIVPDLNVGYASGLGTSGSIGRVYYFPGLYIPSGSRISARWQCKTTTITATVLVFTEGRLASVLKNVAGSAYVTYGADSSNSRGTSVTPGNGSFGSWTSIGSTTSRDHTFHVPCMDGLGTTAFAAQNAMMEIGFGPNAGAVTVIGDFYITQNGNEFLGQFPGFVAYPLSSGSQFWARVASGNTTAVGVSITSN